MGAELVRRLGSSNYNLINFDDRERTILLNEAMDEWITERFIPDMNIKKKGFEFDVKRRLDLAGVITSHVTLKRTSGDFVLGTADNGALPTPDLDYQSSSDIGGLPQVETDYGVFFSIPDECLYIIADTCGTSKGAEIKHNVPVEVVTYEDYYAKIYNVYLSPYYNKVWRLDNGTYKPAGTGGSTTSTKHQLSGYNANMTGVTKMLTTYRSGLLIPGKDWTVESYNMHYIKRPNRILVDTITPANMKNCELHPSVHTEIVDKAVLKAITGRIPEQSKFQLADKDDKENQ